MACRIINRSKRLLIVPLNSGKAVYLAPGESSLPIEDFEINGNDKVAKMKRTNLISTPEFKPEDVQRKIIKKKSKKTKKKK